VKPLPAQYAPRRPVASTVLAWALIALLGVALLWPISFSIYRAFVNDTDGWVGLHWFKFAFSGSGYLDHMGNSLLLAASATLMAMVLAIPLAMVRAQCKFRGAALLSVLVLVPLILPPFVGAMSIRRFLSRDGVLNVFLMNVGWLDRATLNPDWLEAGKFWAVSLLQALHLFPILYLNVSASMANIDPAFEQAARNLGASRWRTFWRVTLPLLRPGLFAGGTIVFIWALTDIGTPLIAGYSELLPVTIFTRLREQSIGSETYALVTILLLGSTGIYLLGKLILGRGMPTGGSKASVATEARRLGLWGTLGAWLLFGVVILLAVLPHIGVILRAFSARWMNTVLPTEWTLEHMRYVLRRPQSYNSIINSLRYSSAATVLGLAVGGAIAWLVVRSRAIGRTVLDTLSMLPLAVPGMIMAAGYVIITAPGTALAAIGPRGNPFMILVIAYAVRRLPFVVRGISAGLQQIPPELEEASRNLGAGPNRTAWRITLPLLTASIVAAVILTFSFSMLEVSDSLMLAQRQADYPITKEIYTQATGLEEAMPRAAAMGVYAMGLLAATMTATTLLLGRRLGAIFRV
jgi:iron(III) transport system permease protein